MKKNFIKAVSMCLVVLMMLSSMVACNKNTDKKTNESPVTSGNSKTQDSTTEAVKEFTYPMEGNVGFTINWGDGVDMYDQSQMLDWYVEYEWLGNLRDETGVTLTDIGGKYGTATPSEEFMLLLASGDYPDIFRANWISFPGGPSVAMNDKYIIPLNDVIDEYMPNFKKYLDEHPNVAKMIRTDDGLYYCFPVINEYPDPAMGLNIRQDWLDKLNIPLPTTMEELHDVLLAFKNELGCKSPLTFELRWLFQQYGTAALSSTYNVLYPFYLENDEVKFGPLEDGYKDFVTVLNQWYKEGLIDQDIASIDKNTVQSKFAAGDAGATIQMLTNIKNAIVSNESSGTEYKVSAIPTLTGGSDYWSDNGVYNGGNAFSISTMCEDVEKVARYIDYMYSEAGFMMLNYGTEGVTYTMVNNQPEFTDFIMKNENELNPSTVMGYVTKRGNWPHIATGLKSESPQYLLDIVETWRTDNNTFLYPAVTHNDEEASYINSNYNNVDTYATEMITKYVIGTEDISTYAKFIENLKTYGIEQILAYKQAAYDRYKAR